MVKLNLKQILIGVSMFSILAAQNSIAAAAGPDTVTIKIGNSKMVFVIYNEDDLKSIESYDMNEVVKQFRPLLDSSDKNNEEILIGHEDLKPNNPLEGSYIEIQTGNGIRVADEKRKESRSSNSFHIDFGLNNWTEKNKQIGSQPYKLDNWGSRYVALSSINKIRIGKNKGPANFQFGAELAWNNLMFQDDITIRKIDGQTQWIDYLDPTISDEFKITKGLPARKGKMTVATIGIPLLFGLDLGQKDDVQLAVGGYINYRLASYTKTVYFDDGDKKRAKNYSDYNLNNWRYGLMATFNYKGLSLFGKYDVSPLFNNNPTLNGVETGDFNVYTFGIRL